MITGRFGLTRIDGRDWLLVKAADEFARRGVDITRAAPASVRSGLSWQAFALAAGQEPRKR